MSASPTIYRPVPRRPFDLPTDDDTPETPDRPPQRSKSTIALTAGALFGIYSQTYDDAAPTPSVTRNNSTANFAELKPRTASPAPPHAPTRRQDPLHLLLRIASLFVFGIAYGIVVTHLHNGARWSPAYLLAWGLAGVGLGSVLPWLDGKDDAPTSVGWTRVVRSIGAFVGIAYAIVRSSPPRLPRTC